jgi:hypothetical protein
VRALRDELAATMEAERTDWASIDAEIEAKVRRRPARAPRGATRARRAVLWCDWACPAAAA